MTAEAIDIELAGVRARIGSSHAPFLRVRRGRTSSRCGRAARASPVVRASLAWHEQSPPRERQGAAPQLARMERIDRDLYRGEGELAWFRIDELPGLHLRFRWDGEHLDVAGDFFYSLSADPVRDRLKRLLYGRPPATPCGSGSSRRCSTTWPTTRASGGWSATATCIRSTPPESRSAAAWSCSPARAASASRRSPPGSPAADGARFLSDTFLLHAGIDVRPVREPLLLDDWSRRWLGEAAGLLQAIDWRYCLGRRGFHWPAERLGSGGRGAAAVVPTRARDALRARGTAGAAQGQIGAGNAHRQRSAPLPRLRRRSWRRSIPRPWLWRGSRACRSWSSAFPATRSA